MYVVVDLCVEKIPVSRIPEECSCIQRVHVFTNVVDDFNREALAIEIDLSLAAPRVIRVLERVALLRGSPEKSDG